MIAMWLMCGLASASDGASRIHVYPDHVAVPLVDVAIGFETSNAVVAPSRPFGELRFAGVGVNEEWSLARVYGYVAVDPLGTPLSAWEVGLTPVWRLSRSRAVPMAADLRLFQVDVGRDEQLQQVFDGRAHVMQWSGGLWLPSVDHGDLDAHVIIDVDLLGFSHRDYDGALTSFTGVYLGSLGGSFLWGTRFNDLVLAAELEGGSAWSLGVSEELALLTDAEVELALGIHGRHLGIVAFGAHRFTRDSGHDLDIGRWLVGGRIEVAQ